ncbi:hypothetical protein KUV28_19255 [Ferrimonas balearica]|nr:hypothetical protein [Ferrimonas balearica]
MSENFQRVMNDDPAVASRFDALAETVVEHFATQGVQITADDLVGNSSLRIAAIAPDAGFNMDRCLSEVRSNPRVSERVNIGGIRKGLEDGTEDLSSLSRYQKMELGRKMDANKKALTPPTEVDPETVAQRILILREVSDPQTRINLARQWNMA